MWWACLRKKGPGPIAVKTFRRCDSFNKKYEVVGSTPAPEEANLSVSTTYPRTVISIATNYIIDFEMNIAF